MSSITLQPEILGKSSGFVTMDSHYEPHHFPGHVVFFSFYGWPARDLVSFRYHIDLWLWSRHLDDGKKIWKPDFRQITTYPNIYIYIKYSTHKIKISTSISGELGHKLTAFYPSQVTRPSVIVVHPSSSSYCLPKTSPDKPGKRPQTKQHKTTSNDTIIYYNIL